MHTRPIPRSGELVPCIGLGTWNTFDVSHGEAPRLRPVLDAFLAGGGRVIDSSPMYGRAEAVAGRLLHGQPRAFVATKVWTSGRAEGIGQMERSIALLGRVDLMQVHNLVDWRTHLATLRDWQRAGRVRYLGITHYAASAFTEMEQILREEHVDFIQLPYSAVTRGAEKRLLPAALDSGTAVLVMRPFEEGGLTGRLARRALPGLAGELGCTSWPQLLLKFILGHPAVTAPIPASANPAHVQDNLAAGSGRLPTPAECEEIARAVRA